MEEDKKVTAYLNLYGAMADPLGVFVDGFYVSREAADENVWQGPIRVACIKVKFEPGQFDQ